MNEIPKRNGFVRFLKAFGIAIAVLIGLFVLVFFIFVVNVATSDKPLNAATSDKPSNVQTAKNDNLIGRNALSLKLKDGFVVEGKLGRPANTITEVVEMLGPPDYSQEAGDRRLLYYRNITRDELSGKPDTVQLVFVLATDKNKHLDWYLTTVSFN